MAIGVGQTAFALDSFGDGIATTDGTDNTAASGSTFWIGAISTVAATITRVVDNKSNTYTSVGSPIQYLTNILKLQLFKCENGAGGSGHIWELEVDNDQFLTFFVVEVTGAGTGGEDTGARASVNDTASPFTVTSGSTAQANELLIAFVGFNTAVISGLAESSGFTIKESVLSGTSDAPGCVATRIVSSTGAYTPSFTGTGLTDCGLWIVAVKEPGGGGGSSLTVDSGSGAFEGQAVTLSTSASFVLPVTTGQGALEGQEIPFILEQPGAEGSGAFEGQQIAMLAQAVIAVTEGQGCGEGQVITLLGANTLVVGSADAAFGQGDVTLRTSMPSTGTGRTKRLRRHGRRFRYK